MREGIQIRKTKARRGGARKSKYSRHFLVRSRRPPVRRPILFIIPTIQGQPISLLYHLSLFIFISQCRLRELWTCTSEPAHTLYLIHVDSDCILLSECKLQRVYVVVLECNYNNILTFLTSQTNSVTPLILNTSLLIHVTA